MQYLLKSEPDQYSIADPEREGETLWDGFTNPVAVRHLSEMKPHDKLIYYHTGNERQAVGTAVVASVDNENPKSPRVHIRFAGRLNAPVSLADIKANKLFADSPLIRQGRLSVVPLTAEQYNWLTKA